MDVSKFLKAKEELYDLVLDEVSNSTPNLKELDHWRNVEFPIELENRYSKGELEINKQELTKLMDWKLKKGKFRPTLKKLIGQNEEDNVIAITKEAFALFLESKDTSPTKEEYKKIVKKALTILVKLRGVGPATASLMLSLLNKITKLAPPFYSDEAAEYVFQNGGAGDEIKLKYSMSEYIKWLDLMCDLNEGYVYDFTDVENGIWAIKQNEYYEVKPKESKGVKEDDDDEGKSVKKRKVSKE